MNVAGVILAAGASMRLGEPKQLLRDQHNETLVHKVAREAIEVGLQPVVVVVGAYADLVQPAVADLDVIIEENNRWSSGISTSIRAGVAAAMESRPEQQGDWADIGREHLDDKGDRWLHVVTTRVRYGGIGGALLLTCDMPSVGKSHLLQLIETFGVNHWRVASQYGETVGIPAIIPAIDFESLQSLEGDRGAKSLFNGDNTKFVPLAGGTFDLDTQAEVAKWRASGAT